MLVYVFHIGDWDAKTVYKNGNLVHYDGCVYECHGDAHIDQPPPPDNDLWIKKEYSPLLQLEHVPTPPPDWIEEGIEEWDPEKIYPSFDKVIFDGHLYCSEERSVAGQRPSAANRWLCYPHNSPRLTDLNDQDLELSEAGRRLLMAFASGAYHKDWIPETQLHFLIWGARHEGRVYDAVSAVKKLFGQKSIENRHNRGYKLCLKAKLISESSDVAGEISIATPVGPNHSVSQMPDAAHSAGTPSASEIPNPQTTLSPTALSPTAHPEHLDKEVVATSDASAFPPVESGPAAAAVKPVLNQPASQPTNLPLEVLSFTPPKRPAPLNWRLSNGILAVLLLIAIMAIVIQHSRVGSEGTRQQVPHPVVTQIEFKDYPIYSVPRLATLAVSPGGTTVVYADGRGPLQLWTAAKLDRPIEVRTTEGAKFPFWQQPDGQSLGFFVGRELKAIHVKDGLPDGKPEKITDVPDPRGGTWYHDTILYSAGPGASLMKVPAKPGSKGSPLFVSPEVKDQGHRFPEFMPGGRSFFSNVVSDKTNWQGLYVGRLDGEQQMSQLLPYGTNAVFVPSVTDAKSGYILYRTDEGFLKASQFDPDRLVIKDPLLLQVSEQAVMDTGYWGSGAFAASMDVLAYRVPEERELVIVDKNGNRLRRLAGPIHVRGTDTSLALSPDGKTVAFSRGLGWKADIVRKEVDSDEKEDPTRFTSEKDGVSWFPAWSLNGVVYYGFQGRSTKTGKLKMKMLSGGESKEVCPSNPQTVNTGPWDLSKDGESMLFRRHDPNDELWLLALETCKETMYLKSEHGDFRDGRFSPDSKWIAFSSNEESTGETPKFQVYVARVSDKTKRRVPVSSRGGIKPRWGAHGNMLYYLSDDGEIMAASFNGDNGGKVGTPYPLFGATTSRRLACRSDSDSDNDKTIEVAVENDKSANAHALLEARKGRRLSCVSGLSGISDYEPKDKDQFILNLPIGGAQPPTVVIIVNWQSALSSVAPAK